MDSTAVAVARQGGVSHAVAAPGFGTGVFAGQGAVLSLAETDGGVVKPQAGLFAALGSAGAGLEGGTRATVWTVLRESLDDAQTYTRNQR
ncbi:MAG: amidohydrolase, partial [Pseudomonadota bacterium]